MRWYNSSYEGARRKFAWLPTFITNTDEVLWLGTYEQTRHSRARSWSRTYDTSHVSGGFKWQGVFTSTYVRRFAWRPVRLKTGQTIWLERYMEAYVGENAAKYSKAGSAQKLWAWRRYDVQTYMELVMTNELPERSDAN